MFVLRTNHTFVLRINLVVLRITTRAVLSVIFDSLQVSIDPRHARCPNLNPFDPGRFPYFPDGRALLCSHHTCSLTLMHAFLFLLAVKEYAGKDMQAHWNHTRRRALWRYQVCRFQQSPYQCREESWIGRASSNGAGSAVDGCNAYSFIQRGQDHLHWCKKASTGA